MITPCQNKCNRAEANNCTDCGRTAYEISRWLVMPEWVRLTIMARLTGNHHYAMDAEEALKRSKSNL